MIPAQTQLKSTFVLFICKILKGRAISFILVTYTVPNSIFEWLKLPLSQTLYRKSFFKWSWGEETEMFPPLQSPLSTQWESCWQLGDHCPSQRAKNKNKKNNVKSEASTEVSHRLEVPVGGGQRRTAGGYASTGESGSDRWRSEQGPQEVEEGNKQPDVAPQWSWKTMKVSPCRWLLLIHVSFNLKCKYAAF